MRVIHDDLGETVAQVQLHYDTTTLMSGALLLAAWGVGSALATIGLAVVGGNLAYVWRLRRKGA